MIKNNTLKLPSELTTIYQDSELKQAQSYSLAKLNLAQIELLLEFLLLILLVPLGVAHATDHFYNQLHMSPTLKGLLFVCTLSSISEFLHLPLQLYQHFILEERFGFNKMTFKIFISDKLKSSALSVFLLFLLISLYMTCLNYLKSHWWWLFFLIFLVFQVVMMIVYPLWIAPWFNRFTPIEEGELKTGLENIFKKAQIKFKEIFIMDASKRSSHGNAYFTGFGAHRRIVLFDTLCQNLNTSEILAVIAHELGHFHYRHILKSLIISSIFALLGLKIFDLLIYSSNFTLSHGLGHASPVKNLWLFLLVLPYYSFFLKPLWSWWSRKNEFEADNYARHLTSAQDMKSALIKLYQKNLSYPQTDRWYSAYYYSHPPVLERLANLDRNQSK